MKPLILYALIAATLVGCRQQLASTRADVLPVSGASPDDRDRQVLETLLLHLLTDTKFDMTRVPTNGATIALHTRTPDLFPIAGRQKHI